VQERWDYCKEILGETSQWMRSSRLARSLGSLKVRGRDILNSLQLEADTTS
jgi:hypothetical protein